MPSCSLLQLAASTRFSPRIRPSIDSCVLFYMMIQRSLKLTTRLAGTLQEDSVLLWKSIVSNKLLKKTNLVLFLNKTDILRAKLGAGIMFSQFIVSYGDRPNDFENTSHCASTFPAIPSPAPKTSAGIRDNQLTSPQSDLRRKFAQIHKEHSPEPRPFYCHFTTVTVSFWVSLARVYSVA